MKLFYTKRSPYAAKVRAVAIEHNIQLDLVEVADLTKKPQELVDANPLGKIPALALDDGTSIFDSPVICAYLDDLSNGKKLIPSDSKKRYQVLTIEALADGIVDAAIGIMMEDLRPEEKRSDTMMQRHLSAINRALEYFDNNVKILEGELNIGNIALACSLNYMNFRFGDRIKWENDFQNLKKWHEEIAKHPTILAVKPSN